MRQRQQSGFIPPLATAQGGFALLDGDLVIATGRITSAGHAVGTVSLAPCGSDAWFARRVP